MESPIILNVQISEVVPDPEVPNYRGPIRDTTSLQPSIRQDGILRPLWVRPSPDDDSTYFLVDGYRRWTAARAVGVTEVPVRVYDTDADGARHLAMLANQTEEWPFIVIDGDVVIGGKCLAVRDLVGPNGKKKVPRYRAAEMMGLTPDVVGALYRLYDDLPEVKKRVANEQIHITVYSIFKKAPDEIKLHILKKRGSISARYVRKVLRDWRDGILDLGEDEEPEEVVEVEKPAEPAAQEAVTQARALNEALTWLRRVENPLSSTEKLLVSRVEKQVLEIWKLGESDDV